MPDGDLRRAEVKEERMMDFLLVCGAIGAAGWFGLDLLYQLSRIASSLERKAKNKSVAIVLSDEEQRVIGAVVKRSKEV